MRSLSGGRRARARLRAIALAAAVLAAPVAALADPFELRLIPEPSAKLVLASGVVLLAALHAQRRRRAQRS
jgi:hypothetical protein